jgi:hypothetical protein
MAWALVLLEHTFLIVGALSFLKVKPILFKIMYVFLLSAIIFLFEVFS